MKTALKVLLTIFFLSSISCTNKSDKTTVWIYTSLYKDTISKLTPLLEKDFPHVKFQFYQAGSEEVAAKVQAESLTGKIQADLLISSDRFWYEDLSRQGSLLSYKPKNTDQVTDAYKNSDGFYTTLSFPVMVMAYNSDVISEADAPKAFSDLRQKKWKDKISSGSPLASGTNFTTVAFLVKKYGWDYFNDLRQNNFIAEGGNSGVIRRLQSKERPVGIVLLENILRLAETDSRIKYMIPSDGVILQSNVLAIVKKAANQDIHQKVADWFFENQSQTIMADSFMYPAVLLNPRKDSADLKIPTILPKFSLISSKAMPWSSEFISETLKNREEIKNKFSKIVF